MELWIFSLYCILLYKAIFFNPVKFFDLEPKPGSGEIFYYVPRNIAKQVFTNPSFQYGAHISITEEQYSDLCDSDDNESELVFKIKKLMEI